MDRILKYFDDLQKIGKTKTGTARKILTRPEKELINRLLLIELSSWERLPVLLEHKERLADAQYWYGLRVGYMYSDNAFEFPARVKEAFSEERPGRGYLMDGSEKRKLGQLPRIVDIYRAMSEGEAKSRDYGVSWTLSESVAEFFRKPHRRSPIERVVKKIQIRKEEVIALLNGRSEEEVIYIKK
jgi:hypothetical protein